MSDALRSSLALLRDRITRAGRDPDTVTLVAVTKTVAVERIQTSMSEPLLCRHCVFWPSLCPGVFGNSG